MRVPVDKASSLLLQMLWRRSHTFDGFNQLFKRSNHAPTISHNGKLSCFFAGISTFLSLSIASARAIRFLVECGMMTSSR